MWRMIQGNVGNRECDVQDEEERIARQQGEGESAKMKEMGYGIANQIGWCGE